MEEPTREMEKETGAETDLPETEPAAEQEEAKKAAEAKEAEAAEETAEDGKERKFFKKKKDKKDEKIEELTDRLTRQMAEFDNFRKRTEKEKANQYEKYFYWILFGITTFALITYFFPPNPKLNTDGLLH